MAIPWMTALYVVRKVLPVVIDKAPDLIKTFERRRTASAPAGSTGTESSLETLRERLKAQEQLMATQMELLTQLQATLSTTRRALAVVWIVLVATILLGTSIAAMFLFRP